MYYKLIMSQGPEHKIPEPIPKYLIPKGLPCERTNTVCRRIIGKNLIDFWKSIESNLKYLPPERQGYSDLAHEEYKILCQTCPLRPLLEKKQIIDEYKAFTPEERRANALLNATETLVDIGYDFTAIKPGAHGGNRNFYEINGNEYAVDKDTSTQQRGLHIHPTNTKARLTVVVPEEPTENGYDFIIKADTHGGMKAPQLKPYVDRMPMKTKLDILALAAFIGKKMGAEHPWSPLSVDSANLISVAQIWAAQS